MQLGDIARLIRSKNAGPFVLTIDIMFEEMEDYDRVVRSELITPALVERLYGVPAARIRVFEVPEALAIKISFPRPVPSGELNDTDIFGGQLYAPFVTLEVPAVVAAG